MNIAIFTDSFFPQINGVSFSIKNRALELQKRGHKILVFAPSPGKKNLRENVEGVDTAYFSSHSLPSYKEYRIVFGGYKKALKLVQEFKPDAIHCETPFSMGKLGQKIARKMKIPCVGTYHTLIPDFLMYLPLPVIKKLSLTKKLAWRITNKFYEKCAVVSTPSEAMKAELLKNGLKADVRPISNGINLELFKQSNSGVQDFLQKNKIPENATKLIFFGRISFEKNIDVLIKALALLNQEKKQRYVLLLVGSGPATEKLKELAEKLAEKPNVFFTGALRDEALVAAVNAAGMFVSASTIETQGLSILEAMACGKPAVAADYLAIPEAVTEGYNGFLFKPFDEKECAEKIKKLAGSEELQKLFAVNAKKTAEQHSMRKIAETWEKIYSGIGEANPA